MSKIKNAPGDGCDPIFDVMDSYLQTSFAAVSEHLSGSVQDKKPEYAAAYVQGCAAIHAAELVAEALDRNSAAIIKLSGAHACTGQHKPVDGYQGTDMSQRAESFVREFETAGRVFFELGNSAADAYDDAALSLFDFVSGGAGLSHVEAQKIYTLLEAYEVKRDAAAEAEVRKAEAVRLFLVEFRHPYPA